LRKLAEAHVLSILDCCFASSAALKNVNEDFRIYQLLAASAVERKTCGPGKNSFTTALITSLEELLDEHKDKSFPVTNICEAINLKRKKVPALLWDHPQKHKRSLQLAPLQPGNASQEEREKSFRSGNPEQASLAVVKVLSVPAKMRRRRSSIRRSDEPEVQGDSPSNKRFQPDESFVLSSPKRRISEHVEKASHLTPISSVRMVAARESSSSTMEI
jgi:hypothetical protein